MMQTDKIAVIGAGKLGSALARALSEHGFTVIAIYDRDANRAIKCAQACGSLTRFMPLHEFPADLTLLFFCVPDDELENAAQQAADKLTITRQTVAAHCSGTKSAEILLPLKKLTHHLASCHPVQTFPGLADDWQRLSNIFFGLEGEAGALEKLQQLVQNLNSQFVIIPSEKKPLYHLGCALASNYLVAIADTALEVMQSAGIESAQAIPVLEPLLRATLDNVIANGPARAATGPIIRGDAGTVQEHIAALHENIPELLPLYSLLGMRLAHIASDRPDSNREKLAKIEGLLLTEIRKYGLDYE
ncbi:MAG TPA: DUF2520 domain-containing protein [bacterium]|nr:DUF2520 domain-containing protein [bacterium]HPN45241.1 DUF2520 domain-containing protein [bacterium]